MRIFTSKTIVMSGRILVLTLAFGFFLNDGFPQSEKSKRLKNTQYEEVDFEDLVHRYVGKESGHPLEGIYSVSCVITKRNKKLLSKAERIRIVERKDNYGRVAIIKDWPGSSKDFIEVSLSYRDAKRYPIVGHLSFLADSEGMIYKHIEPDGTTITFSMLSESIELLEAEYSDMQKRKTITYRLSYLKIYPKTGNTTVFNN
jgi:hypothetical protein